MIFPLAFKTPFPIPFIPLAIIISPPASIWAPSTTPFTSMFPRAFTEKLAQTVPFTCTLPSYSIFPVELSTFSTVNTSDTNTFPSTRLTCPSTSEIKESLSSESVIFLPNFSLHFFTSLGFTFSPSTLYPTSPKSSGNSFANTSPWRQWLIVFRLKKSTLPSSFKVGFALKSVLK